MLVLMVGLCLGMIWLRICLIWWSYGGLKVYGYGGFREKFKRRKKLWCLNEGRRRKKKLDYRGERVRTTVPLQARAVPVCLEKGGFLGVWLGTAVPPQSRAVPVFLV